MEQSSAVPGKVRFGPFEADFVAGELRKRDRRVPLQDQPFQVLAFLLRRRGELVTREELQHALWPADTFVEFDHGVNTAINKIRQALGDSADNPRFIETLPRKGYRFIAPVEAAVVPVQAPVPASSRHWLWILAAAAGFVAVSLAVGWLLRSPHKSSEAVLVPVPLTSYPGEEEYPSFSPDGAQVAYQWCPEGPGKNCEIYIKQIGVEPPFRLTDTPQDEYSPAWSPDGQTIAFVRDLALPTKMALILIPQRGGPERVLTEFEAAQRSDVPDGPYLAWTPDSKWLVSAGFEGSRRPWSLFLISVDTGEKRRLTTPPASSFYGDTSPALSPDGRNLAFIRAKIGACDLFRLRLANGHLPRGEPERIPTYNPLNFSPTWTADGHEIVFASGNFINASLWRTAASKSAKPRRLAFASDQTSAPAVSRQGNRLAYVVSRYDRNIWRVELSGPGQRVGNPVRWISSTQLDWGPAYSPDGKRTAFLSLRSGVPEIWISDRDGANAMQLTSFGGPLLMGPRWSPDGQSIAVTADIAGSQDIYVIRASGGAHRRLTTHPARDKWPYWSRDGRWLYFCSERTGRDEIWKMPASGGEAVQLTRNGGDLPQESPDGRWLYYSKGYPRPLSVWRMPVEGGEETNVLDSVNPVCPWDLSKEGIYFAKTGLQGHNDISFYEFATGRTREIVQVERPFHGLALSPDGRAILYTQQDEIGSDLMLVENFR